MMDYFNGNWHNRWLILGYLIDKGELDIVLSPMATFFSKWEYECMEALENDAEWEADKASQLEVLLDDEFTRSLWLCDVSLRIRETGVIVTNCWLEDQFQDSLQWDEVALVGRME